MAPYRSPIFVSAYPPAAYKGNSLHIRVLSCGWHQACHTKVAYKDHPNSIYGLDGGKWEIKKGKQQI